VVHKSNTHEHAYGGLSALEQVTEHSVACLLIGDKAVDFLVLGVSTRVRYQLDWNSQYDLHSYEVSKHEKIECFTLTTQEQREAPMEYEPRCRMVSWDLQH
jgi:hypothetical protein